VLAQERSICFSSLCPTAGCGDVFVVRNLLGPHLRWSRGAQLRARVRVVHAQLGHEALHLMKFMRTSVLALIAGLACTSSGYIVSEAGATEAVGTMIAPSSEFVQGLSWARSAFLPETVVSLPLERAAARVAGRLTVTTLPRSYLISVSFTARRWTVLALTYSKAIALATLAAFSGEAAYPWARRCRVRFG
jgi:hypothetical protein